LTDDATDGIILLPQFLWRNLLNLERELLFGNHLSNENNALESCIELIDLPRISRVIFSAFSGPFEGFQQRESFSLIYGEESFSNGKKRML